MILELHGSLHSPNGTTLVQRRMLTRDKLLRWAANQRPFVSREEALLGEGMAVTIDDGTYAAYETALELRSIGHQVTVYVNMSNVLTRKNYFFHELSALLDKFFEVSNPKRINISIDEKEEFRRQIKTEFIKLVDEADCGEYLESFRARHSINFDYSLPKELQCIGIEECKELSASGVRLGNHCFAHYNPSVKSLSEFEWGVIENAALLKKWFNTEDNFCAIPFGKWLPPIPDTSQLKDYVWLLADRARRVGSISANTFNRHSIDNDLDLEKLSHE
jgi:hypothetical protein